MRQLYVKPARHFLFPFRLKYRGRGKGAHLWIFFSENISAKRARNLGMLILQAAMNERHSLPFESFDRMFPNQDSIPKGGYGNLIALPLQGQVVKNKYSVFVDEDFISFDDQWAYLSSVKKLSAKDLETCCIEITKVVHDFLPDGCDDSGINKTDDIAKDGTAYKISGILSNNPSNQNKQSNNPASKNVQLTQKDLRIFILPQEMRRIQNRQYKIIIPK